MITKTGRSLAAFILAIFMIGSTAAEAYYGRAYNGGGRYYHGGRYYNYYHGGRYYNYYNGGRYYNYYNRGRYYIYYNNGMYYNDCRWVYGRMVCR